jgi:hypothetical protein
MMRYEAVWVRTPFGPWWCVVDTARRAPDGGALVVADGGLGWQGCSLARDKARWLETLTEQRPDEEE